MKRVLVSACLLGDPVRHDAQHKRSHHPVLQRWIAEGRVVRVCPELEGGLPVPRPAAEIAGGAGGRRVLLGEARVVTRGGEDVSAAFVKGAQAALALAGKHAIRVAVLKARSPSCGSSESYDGTFELDAAEEALRQLA